MNPLTQSKNTTILPVLIALALGCFAFSPTAIEVTPAGNAGYPNQNTAPQGLVKQSFPVGNDPFFLVFDGANIWVTNAGEDTVTKLRASDGANLGTFPVGGLFPEFITFDGANIWVSNNISNNVTKLRASDGVVLGTFPVGDSPEGIAYDGANIWVTNYSDDTVTKLRASDGVVLGVYPVGSGPMGVLFDGTSIWVANYLDNTL